MIIARFGSAWSGAYEFTNINAVDNWQIVRQPVSAPVSGASGVFDFYGLDEGDENYPVGPLLITKGFTLTASTYAGISTVMNTLRANTIAAGRSKLWGHLRDGTDAAYRRYIKARCVNLKEGEVAGGQYLNMPVELQFFCPEGVWYKNTGETQVETGAGTHTVTNDGNYPALLYVKVDFTSGTNTQVEVVNNTNGAEWTHAANVTGSLIVDAKSMLCTADGADSYANMTFGAGQVAWMWLDPGANSIDVTITGGTLDDITYVWQDTYLL